MSRLLVAAGGGGDAIAAAMLAAACGDAAGIASYSWDRLIVNPLPGPRGAESFTGLLPLGSAAFQVTADARAVDPAGSTLPRLAGCLKYPVALMDPGGGAAGIAVQLREAAAALGAEAVTLVDVGGDVLAAAGDADVSSPLADAVAAAAVAACGLPATAAVIGPGLDGEIDPAVVLARLAALGARRDLLFGPDHCAAVAEVLTWHPSEVSGLVWSAAAGRTGVVEIRDGGSQITLDPQAAAVWSFPYEAGFHQLPDRRPHVVEVDAGRRGGCPRGVRTV